MPTKTSTLKATVMVHHRGLPLTSHEFAATDLWSDAYLASPAVHEALDNFWTNTVGPGGVGLQDRFAAMWAHVAQQLGNHPAVAGYDFPNEPTPGSAEPEIFANIIGGRLL